MQNTTSDTYNQSNNQKNPILNVSHLRVCFFYVNKSGQYMTLCIQMLFFSHLYNQYYPNYYFFSKLYICLLLHKCIMVIIKSYWVSVQLHFSLSFKILWLEIETPTVTEVLLRRSTLLFFSHNFFHLTHFFFFPPQLLSSWL